MINVWYITKSEVLDITDGSPKKILQMERQKKNKGDKEENKCIIEIISLNNS